jgi:hypothetical protein
MRTWEMRARRALGTRSWGLAWSQWMISRVSEKVDLQGRAWVVRNRFKFIYHQALSETNDEQALDHVGSISWYAVTQFADPFLPLLGTKHNNSQWSAIDHAKQNKQNEMKWNGCHGLRSSNNNEQQPTNTREGRWGGRGHFLSFCRMKRLINHLASYLLKTMRLLFSWIQAT